jgi:hypothetical protein
MEKNVTDSLVERIRRLSTKEQKALLEMLERKEKPSSKETRRPIWEVAAEISASIPLEEWEKLPSDGSVNHDHYLYGSPKRY